MPKQSSNNEPVAPKTAAESKTNWGFQKTVLGLALGILIGYLFTQRVTDFLPSLLPALMAVFIALFLFIIIAVLALPRIINYLAKRYTGQDVDVEAAVGDIQAKANHIADTIAGYALAKADPEVRKNIRQDLPGILHYLVFSRLRNSGLRMLMTVFVAIGGLMGTILLYNQNQLLSSQNSLLLNQNEKIDNQIQLEEASRRSSLNFLLGNVLDQVNQELSDPENTERRLSPQLIGRIASLSQSFQPYYFMEDGEMIERVLSPERAALLLALINSGLDTMTLKIILEKTNFKNAALQEAEMDSAYLVGATVSGVDLRRANLRYANFERANFGGLNGTTIDLANSIISYDLQEFGADLSYSNLRSANLSETIMAGCKLNYAILHKVNFRRANLKWADLQEAYLREADLSECKLEGANLSGAILTNANLNGADLTNANLHEATGLTVENLSLCSSLYNVKGLQESLARKFKAEIEKQPFRD